MTGRAIMRRWPVGAFILAALLMVQPLPLAAQTDAAARREVRVLETVEPSTGRRSLHVMEGLSPDEVRAVQQALSDAGFREPWREGTLDPFTRGALQRFQTHRELTVCACVSLETLIELDLEVRVAETIVLEEPPRPEAEDVEEVADAGEVGPRDATPTYVDYGRYYPYGVIYLAPYIHPYYAPVHGPLAGGGSGGALSRRAGRGFAIGARFGGVHLGAAVGPGPASGSFQAARSLGPFPRVNPPPNVVRGGG
jgi:hypothetical protein